MNPISAVTPSTTAYSASAAYSRVQALSDINRESTRDRVRADVRDSSARATFGPATRVTLSAEAHSAIAADRAERLAKADKEAANERQPEPQDAR